MRRAELASWLEVALTRPDATRSEVEHFCTRAREQALYGVVVHGVRVELARAVLDDSPLKITALVSYPLGAADADVKRYATEVAIDHGAHEIEFVANLGRLKDGDHAGVLRELRDIVEAADERPVKAIFEFRYLNPEQRRLVCDLVADSGVALLAVSSGLIGPAAAAEVRQAQEWLGRAAGVKAAGVADAALAQALLEAGAARLGAAEAGALLAALEP